MEYFRNIGDFLSTQGINLLRGIIVLVVGFFLVHWALKLVSRNEKYIRMDPTLKGFLDNLMRIVLYIVVILTAVNVMGIPMTSVVALVASAGVAISMAVQGALSNLVGGLMLLLLKPIKVDEYIKVGDIEGTVKRIGAFYTELATPDNRYITMPNSLLTNTSIINNARLGTRRLDVFFSVSYRADIDHVKQVLTSVMNRCEGILPDPEPAVKLTECGESALKFNPSESDPAACEVVCVGPLPENSGGVRIYAQVYGGKAQCMVHVIGSESMAYTEDEQTVEIHYALNDKKLPDFTMKVGETVPLVAVPVKEDSTGTVVWSMDSDAERALRFIENESDPNKVSLECFQALPANTGGVRIFAELDGVKTVCIVYVVLS